MELIIIAMKAHEKQPFVAEQGCAALASISLRNPANCTAIVVAGGPEVILKAMQLHSNVVGVQVSCQSFYASLHFYMHAPSLVGERFKPLLSPPCTPPVLSQNLLATPSSKSSRKKDYIINIIILKQVNCDLMIILLEPAVIVKIATPKSLSIECPQAP